MRKKQFLMLFLLIAFAISLHSCINDTLLSSVDPESKEYQARKIKEYQSKSLWPEDEKYIKNVMQVYFENETEIMKVPGTPYWEYATTIGSFDESFLMVPIVDKDRVVSVLQVPRDKVKNKIFFYYTNFTEHLEFFDHLAFSQYKKAIYPEGSETGKSIICTRQWYSVWMPDSESNPDPDSGAGHWENYSVVRCQEGPLEPDQCISVIGPNGECEGGGGQEYPYPGGGNNPDPEDPDDEEKPCGKINLQRQDPNFTAKITDLEGNTGLKAETGYIQKTDGSYTYQDVAGQNETSNTLSLPNANLPSNQNIIAYMHTHVDSYTTINAEGDEETRTGIKMFSPADISYFMDMLRNAQAAGRPLTDVYAVMVTSNGNYQIRFTGNQYQLKNFTTQQLEDFTKSFKEIMKQSYDLEFDFLKFLSEKMNVKATNLYKMDADGTNYEIKLSEDKTTKSTAGCTN
ncbi:hypothetical protein [Chryseobacterium sp.]|uniref:hypothetical protein n=1 Tax=Chryseobacterium sp. TaxID=1871047 RepID=UPI0033420EE6